MTDAAETIEVDYDPLPAVVDTKGALAGDAPQVWPFAKKNLAVDQGIINFDDYLPLR